jgi:hypothetical protein
MISRKQYFDEKSTPDFSPKVLFFIYHESLYLRNKLSNSKLQKTDRNS